MKQQARVRRTLAGLALAFGPVLGLAGFGNAAHAADAYPDKPIRLVVPYPPGGNLDITTRAISTAMARILKQSIVVENLGGAGGSIGASNVARSAPDGYTLLSTTIVPLVVNPTLVPGTKVHLDDFEPAGMLAVVPSVLEVPARGKKNIKDFPAFIAYAKAHPGELSVSHSGNGTTNHIAALLMQRDFGIKVTLVPYKGSGPALSDLLGGQVDAMVDQLTSSLPQIQSGGLHALAVTSAQRVPDLQQVPTVAELGKQGFEMVTYSAIVAPKGTPLAIRQKLNDALAQAVADPTVQHQLAMAGSQVVKSTIDQSVKTIAAEQAKLQPLITSGALKPE
ncbi:tripartite tricarboxylate transporter substrate binding protein [Bordetella sp. N]|uniref:Bug family tripartite tricarboxylate transporter substrate binding protein n=1 Tax=Bordetella sp. N TaxID=1746199 RepID=UPI00070BE7BC|nr:tripartite tricarboxylate transporter substrate binding protein [Bordetella sp. N]ALM81736.1 hypothetical protein ASB57_01020 [Bordetella sp. N]